MTERLFDQNSYCREFEAVVETVIPERDHYQVILNQTAFFPEGGGQSADTGTLNGLYVSDVQEKDGIVYHKMEQPPAVAERVEGILDWSKRYDRMQQHTGEHILSGLVHNEFGYDNAGFHLGEENCTVDFNGLLTKAQAAEIEILANEAIYKNLPLEILYPNKEELAELDYRSKIEIEGQVRLVQIPGYDLCACCAPHLQRTGEIGLIKLVSMQNYKGGVRLSVLCGLRALADYSRKEENVKQISTLLSAKEESISEAVGRLKQENEELKNKLYQQQMQLVAYKAEQIAAENQVICYFEAELTGEAPRELANRIIKKGARLCAVFCPDSNGDYRYIMGGSTEDIRPIGKQLNQAFNGRGGGSSQMVQGMLRGEQENILKFFDQYKQ